MRPPTDDTRPPPCRYQNRGWTTYWVNGAVLDRIRSTAARTTTSKIVAAAGQRLDLQAAQGSCTADMHAQRSAGMSASPTNRILTAKAASANDNANSINRLTELADSAADAAARQSNDVPKKVASGSGVATLFTTGTRRSVATTVHIRT